MFNSGNSKQKKRYIIKSLSFIIIFVITFMFVIPFNSFAAPSFEKKTTNVCKNEKNEVNYKETSYYENGANNTCNNEDGDKSSRRSDPCSNGQCPTSVCDPISIGSLCNSYVYLHKFNNISSIKRSIIVSSIYSVFKPPKKSLI